jgi:two-component system, NtrC family, nitrogen regulation response regulator GlnG
MNTETKTKVLVVDDEPSICWGFQRLLKDEGFEVMVASSAEAGLTLAEKHTFALVLLDVRLPGEDGLSALPKFMKATHDAPIVVMTAFGDLQTAVTALRQGATDYLTKPFPLEQATKTCRQAIKHGELKRSAVKLSGDKDLVTLDPAPVLVGNSPAMQSVFRQIAMVAQSPLSVLITGETGTGKELVAAAIHRHSERCKKPYLTVAPVAFSESLFESELFGHVRGAFTGANDDRKGLFELANGGTVLLDEIGDLPIASQVKLLRVIEQQQYTPVGDVRPRTCDVRIIAATHRDLGTEVRDGRFREDLMYRLAAVRIHLPPLRERTGDLPILCRYFLQRIGHPFAEHAISDSLADELCERPWYGNVRELRHAIEHAAVFARNRAFDISDFPLPQVNQRTENVEPSHANLSEVLERWTRQQLEAGNSAVPLYERFLSATEPTMFRVVLNENLGNRAAAAETLGIHRATLRERLRKHGMDDASSSGL